MSVTQITWRDVVAMPGDGKRYEAIGGELYVTSEPHQLIVLSLAVE